MHDSDPTPQVAADKSFEEALEESSLPLLPVQPSAKPQAIYQNVTVKRKWCKQDSTTSLKNESKRTDVIIDDNTNEPSYRDLLMMFQNETTVQKGN